MTIKFMNKLIEAAARLIQTHWRTYHLRKKLADCRRDFQVLRAHRMCAISVKRVPRTPKKQLVNEFTFSALPVLTAAKQQ